MPYFVYIIQNSQGRLYIGLAENVQARLEQHNTGVSKWTRNRGPWQLIWLREFPNLSEAKRFETLLKKQKGGEGLYKLTGLARSGS